MKYYNAKSDEIIYGTANELIVISEFQNILRNGNEEKVFKGITIQAKAINGIKSNNQLKNVISTKKALEKFLMTNLIDNIYYNPELPFEKMFYRVIKREDDVAETENCITLSFITVVDTRDNYYSVLSYDNFKRLTIISEEYQTLGKTLINERFDYDKLIAFLNENNYKIFEFDEHSEDEKKEKINVLKNIVSEITDKLNFLDFEEFEVKTDEIKDLSDIKEDLELLRKEK